VQHAPSVLTACRGVSQVLTTVATTISRQPGDSITGVDLNGQLGLIDAARAAGVAHFTYLSVSAGLPATIPYVAARRSVEDYLRSNGMDFVILGPTPFMEIWLTPFSGFDPLAGRVRVFGSGKAPISYVSLHDVAAFAVGLVGRTVSDGARIEVGGPETLTPLEVVAIFEEVGGRRIQVDHVPEEALEHQVNTSADEYERTLAALALTFARTGNPVPMNETVRPDGRPLASVRDYAREVFKTAAAPAGS
jgi:uncharacterized protein YbjT (DUF2867 family)